jgi:hypothetical protein
MHMHSLGDEKLKGKLEKWGNVNFAGKMMKT